MTEKADEIPPLNYSLDTLERENKRHYISAGEQDIEAMLQSLDLDSLDQLFAHLDAEDKFSEPPAIPEESGYEEARKKLFAISEKNHRPLSFIGDGLPVWKTHPIAERVANIRNLTTSYTPYQPERSQGTLITHWIYQCTLSMLTGFEAINSSLYDRSSGLYEAFCCSLRLKRKADTVLISEGIYPGDLEVLKTLTSDTEIEVQTIPIDAKTGVLNPESVREACEALGDRLAAFAFPQVNSFGLLEPVDTLTDLCASLDILSIGIIDPMHLAQGGLQPPSQFGKNGTDMIVGEGQHLAIGPNFGGPGLGIFGVRYNSEAKNSIRQTPGRYVGKALDEEGRDCRVMILSTREQHIRKDKATSNICSNQAFLATMAGAALLTRGDQGLRDALDQATRQAQKAARKLSALEGVDLAYPKQPFLNEITLRLDRPVAEILQSARTADIQAGVDVSDRGEGNLLKVSFSDLHNSESLERLVTFFQETFEQSGEAPNLPEIPADRRREAPIGLPDLSPGQVEEYYQKLGALNVGPEAACYPLGSCTMKYNPYLNDWAANLPGFVDVHPQAPLEDAQGCLEIIHETQEWFKGITGLSAVTTQPVAGAQGELVGIKMFQAYHRDRNETQRDVILIPQSAHGTNFATAVMAGYPTRKKDGKKSGIIYLEADSNGCIDVDYLDSILNDCGDRVAGIMITNPNTGGIFEKRFRDIAAKIHAVGGLVYMDGANMNAIAGWVNLAAIGVDAVHNNTHKTWTIPHGGGGPGDAFVAVSEKLVDFLPGRQVTRNESGLLEAVRPSKSIGSFHRHWGNFAHKVRCYAYLLRLGNEGVRRMSAVAVLSARYLCRQLEEHYPTLPKGAEAVPRMHEFIITLSEDDFNRIESAGIPKAQAIPRIGKLFLDYGYHAPTVAFPEIYGLMLEPTESYTKAELDRFIETVIEIRQVIEHAPEVLHGVPYFTPISRVDEVSANRQPVTSESLDELPEIHPNRIDPLELLDMPVEAITEKIREVSQKKQANQKPAAV